MSTILYLLITCVSDDCKTKRNEQGGGQEGGQQQSAKVVRGGAWSHILQFHNSEVPLFMCASVNGLSTVHPSSRIRRRAIDIHGDNGRRNEDEWRRKKIDSRNAFGHE